MRARNVNVQKTETYPGDTNRLMVAQRSTSIFACLPRQIDLRETSSRVFLQMNYELKSTWLMVMASSVSLFSEYVIIDRVQQSLAKSIYKRKLVNMLNEDPKLKALSIADIGRLEVGTYFGKNHRMYGKI